MSKIKYYLFWEKGKIMEKNCKNYYCLHNNNNKCNRCENVSNMGMCKSMIILDTQFNHKVYKHILGDCLWFAITNTVNSAKKKNAL